ncbi:hypothetical protein Kfla_6260 [Kribbella flavida DSM 17836]|uniref:Lipoprotein n=1 Tax=Kribbella flavida (strain DSM 17836 / JCM 10339 / NBRC 14399) TaxID=479435 RepID=D2PVM3_KRIFD|nr:hypothetical protein [Kribbella flavida]ADB35263.1 hypothetical protein Kfla_6260 [Kribbella flavida DSM 17836]
MGMRPFRGLTLAVSTGTTLAVLLVAGCAGAIAPAQSALIATETAKTAQAAQAAPVRTVKITSLRTTDYTKGTLTVSGTLTPAPAAGSRVALQRWDATKGWQEIGHGTPSGTAVTISSNQPGSVRTYRLAIGPQAPYAAAASAPAGYSHYVWRGIFKKPLLASGGTGHPAFTVVPPAESPRRAEAELLADKGGVVWGDVNSAGCSWVKNWLGNLTDGTVRTSLLNGATVLGSVDQPQESETWLNRQIPGVNRLRVQVADLRSGYGPQVALDAMLLCTN